MDIKKKYMEYIKTKKYFLKAKNKDELRISTYNIHYWSDVWENYSLKKILDDIKYINADIICLQEVIFGIKYKLSNKIINTENIISRLNNMGYYTIFCNTLPTWYGGIYGNMICIKKKYTNYITTTNFTFDKSKKTCVVSGGIDGIKETRCYILLELKKYVIICCHLDVCSELERKKQIKYIINLLNKKEYKNKKSILLGDLNTTDINQYTEKKKKKEY
jgi:endonuclease/exonuclease/phosphatase family metal-dependent hydrolase